MPTGFKHRLESLEKMRGNKNAEGFEHSLETRQRISKKMKEVRAQRKDWKPRGKRGVGVEST